MHSIGEFVVRPNAGICKIEAIEMMEIGGGKKEYYVLFPVKDGRARFYVPTDADETRIRSVMTKEEAEALIAQLEKIEALVVVNEKQREQQYKEAIMKNDPRALVTVIKNIYARGQKRVAQGKKVTSTDEKYYKQVEKALYSELAFSLEVDQEKIQKKIVETIWQ